MWFSFDDCLLNTMCLLSLNVQLVETKLAKFVEEIVAPPSLVTVIIDGEVNIGQMTLLLWFCSMIGSI